MTSIQESVPLEQVTRDNPHGTNWKFLQDNPEESYMLKPCACNGACTNQEPRNLGNCDNCGTYYCSWCHGFRAVQTYVSDEDYWATYGYHAATNEWHLWAN